MSAVHTPGPWWVAEQGKYRVASIAPATNIYADLMPTQGRIAADAGLIAAAPTMHEYIAKRADAGDNEAKQILESINAGR